MRSLYTRLHEGMLTMPKRFVISVIAWAGILVFLPTLSGQNPPSNASGQTNREKWNNPVPVNKSAYAGKTAVPAPKRDLSGVWDGTAEGGGAFQGAREFPEDGKPEHELPYTALGRETLMTHKPGIGVRAVAVETGNDPVNICDPQGFPRMELYELRTIELAQTADQVIYLDQFNDNWRIIWTDGRELPKDPDPRWNGYSVGKWIDDYTFVAETVGMDERTWLDNTGRPHSSELRVEERFHRASRDILELTVTIDDPKMYTKPWIAVDKIPLHLQPTGSDMREMICAPSETADYNKQIGAPEAAGGDGKDK
jgi:hypothetical protein